VLLSPKTVVDANNNNIQPASSDEEFVFDFTVPKAKELDSNNDNRFSFGFEIGETTQNPSKSRKRRNRRGKQHEVKKRIEDCNHIDIKEVEEISAPTKYKPVITLPPLIAADTSSNKEGKKEVIIKEYKKTSFSNHKKREKSTSSNSSGKRKTSGKPSNLLRRTIDKESNTHKNKKSSARKKGKSTVHFNSSDKGKAMVNHNSLAVRREKSRIMASNTMETDSVQIKDQGSNAFSFGFNFENILPGIE